MKYSNLIAIMAVSACMVFGNPVKAQVKRDDSLALVDIYNYTNGANWRPFARWQLNKPVSTWWGVFLTGNRVTNLGLFNLGLAGTIPPSIGDLDALTQIDLGGNALTDTIPASMGKLTQLTALSLGPNQLTGNVPISFGKLIHVGYFNLSYNRLTGLPATIGNMQSIYGLYIRGNLFTTLPPTLSNLTSLNSFYADGNMLTSLPSWIGKLVNVNVMVLNNNQFSDSIPVSIGRMQHLVILNLDNNQLTGSIPASLGNVGTLRFLSAANNHLTGSIPSSLGKLAGIQGFNFSNNNLSGQIPGNFSNIGNNAPGGYTTTIDLSNNHLSGRIPQSFEKFTRVSALILNNNMIGGKIPATLGSMVSLVSLDLSNNLLEDTIPASLGNITGLTSLLLDSNMLTGSVPSSFANLTNLQYLDLAGNQLSGNPYFGYTPSIKTLDITYNRFTFTGIEDMGSYAQHAKYSNQANLHVLWGGNTLRVNAGGTLANNTYTWYRNGVQKAKITGDSAYHPTLSGAYTVKVTNALATRLTLKSDTVNFVPGPGLAAAENNSALAAGKSNTLSVYPNPAKGAVTLQFGAMGKYTITISALNGKILYTTNGVAGNATNTALVNVSNLPGGMYIVTVTGEKNERRTTMLSKQ